MFQRARPLVGRLLFAAEHHVDAAVRRELDDHVRAFVGHPDIVAAVDLYGMRERPGVEVTADLAQKPPVGAEFEQLSRGGAVGGPRRVPAREREDMPLRIERNAGDFAKIDVGRQAQRIRNGIIGDRRDRVGERETRRQDEPRDKAAGDRHETATMHDWARTGATAEARWANSKPHWFLPGALAASDSARFGRTVKLEAMRTG